MKPRAGFIGGWDRLVGPGMTAGETTLVLASGLFGGLLAAWSLAKIGAGCSMILIWALVAFDAFAGAVCNATVTTRVWYSRPGQGRRKHFLFVLPHLGYFALAAATLRGNGFDWRYFVGLSGAMLSAAALILFAPSRLKLPVAFALFLGVLSFASFAFGSTRGVEWLVPALLLKLLLGHCSTDTELPISSLFRIPAEL